MLRSALFYVYLVKCYFFLCFFLGYLFKGFIYCLVYIGPLCVSSLCGVHICFSRPTLLKGYFLPSVYILIFILNPYLFIFI